MLLAIVHQDVIMLTTLIRRVGSVPADMDERGLSTDVADFVGHYATLSLEHFDLSGALNDMVEIIHRHKITLPVQASMLIKVLITLEGTTKLLAPQFSLMEVMLDCEVHAGASSSNQILWEADGTADIFNDVHIRDSVGIEVVLSDNAEILYLYAMVK